MFERALLVAFISTRTNNAGWSLDDLDLLFKTADRDKLRAAGDSLPSAGPFTVYRGVAGDDPFRKEPGYSWTASPGLAAWFATRSLLYGIELHDPAVLVTEVSADEVLAHLDSEQKGRGEAEFLLRATRWDRLDPMPKPEPGRVIA